MIPQLHSQTSVGGKIFTKSIDNMQAQYNALICADLLPIGDNFTITLHNLKKLKQEYYRLQSTWPKDKIKFDRFDMFD